MNELAHSKPHSDIVEECAGRSHVHVSLGRVQMVLHDDALAVMQCHEGWASVKTVMKVCWASKSHAKETRTDWRNWDQLKSPMQSSTVEPTDGRCLFCGSENDDDERRGVLSAIQIECTLSWA